MVDYQQFKLMGQMCGPPLVKWRYASVRVEIKFKRKRARAVKNG